MIAVVVGLGLYVLFVLWAHEALMENNRPHVVYGLGLTVLLGISFTALQAIEYSHAPFGLTDGIYPVARKKVDG